MDKTALHITANSSIFLVSEYGYDAPLPNSGKIVRLGDQTQFFVIPGIESGADILGSWFASENRLVFYTGTTLYFADLSKNTIRTYDLSGRHSVQFSDWGVSFIKDNEDGSSVYSTILFEHVYGGPS